MPVETTSQSFFEEKYRLARDPWSFASSPYELSRYSKIMDALGGQIYRRAFEPGCSIGVLTAQLARRCVRVDAIDIAPTAVRRARERCRAFTNVHIQQGALPDGIPTGSFDLIVLSEVGYYFTPASLISLTLRLASQLDHCGTFLAAHWLGSSEDHLLSGDEVHDCIGAAAGLTHRGGVRYASFRVDIWERE